MSLLEAPIPRSDPQPRPDLTERPPGPERFHTLRIVAATAAMGLAVSLCFPLCLANGKATAFIAALLVAALYRPGKGAGIVRIVGAGAVLLAAGLLLQPWMVPLYVVLPAAILCPPDLLTELRSTVLRAACGVSGLLMVDATGVLWPALNEASWRLTRSLTGRIDAVRELGYTEIGAAWFYLGLVVVILCAASGKNRVKRAGLASIALAGGILCSGLLGHPWPLAATAIAALSLVARDRTSAGWRSFANSAAVVVGAAFLAALSFEHLSAAPVESEKVFWLANPGAGSLSIPKGLPKDASAPAEARFGALLPFLQGHGWKARTASLLSLIEDLRKGQKPDVIGVSNPTEFLNDKDSQTLSDYVRSGGRLLVLGDHTDIQGTLKPLNRILEVSSIRFRFDSATADSDSPQWRMALRSAWVPDFWGRDNTDFNISIGASLDVRSPARVLVSGEKGFSDPGDYRAGSNLGNLSYDFGGKHGGITLAAEQRVGDGWIQVWGDTSGFQDTSLASGAAFLLANLDRLDRGSAPLLNEPWMAAIPIACFLFAAASGLSAPGLLLAFGATSAAYLGLGAALKPTSRPTPPHFAVFDRRYAPHYPMQGLDYGTFKFRELWLRKGSMLVDGDAKTVAAAGQKQWLVINAPTKTISNDEAKSLYDFVNQGGKLLLFAGSEQRGSAAALLDAFGASVGTQPFGRAMGSVYPAPRIASLAPDRYGTAFMDAYEVSCIGGTPLATWQKTPIAIERRTGKGIFILIGDARFITDENLGKTTSINLAPNRFLFGAMEP